MTSLVPPVGRTIAADKMESLLEIYRFYGVGYGAFVDGVIYSENPFMEHDNDFNWQGQAWAAGWKMAWALDDLERCKDNGNG